MLREVTVVSSLQSTPVKFMTQATTFGQLKTEFSANNVSFNDDLKVALRGDNGATALLDSSILPETSFIIMMTPKKVKSGK
jgi:hypothetical protein